MANFSYEVFAAVVEKGSFFHAAQSLNVTPSAVSHSINQLETDLGFALFLRNRSGVELTNDGKTVLPVIQSILNTEEELRQVADNIKGLNSGRIRIGAFSSVCINWLPTILRRFKSEYPQIEVTIFQGDFNQIVAGVREGTIDIGFSSLPIEDNLLVQPLIKDPIYCVAPTDFVPQDGKAVTKKDIGKRRFILQQIDYDRDTKNALDRYNVTPNSLTYSIDDQSILSMVESGLGLGILPKLALKKLTGDVHIYPFDREFARTICLVMNKTQAQAPSTKRMTSEINRFLKESYPDRLFA
ncbi:MAG: LysR family transcriptional regulator [Oenococcus sp.]|uniref:CysB-like cys regulon transcriptional activator n=1 Tax=Oenococcus kitaharae DSM 17330 TaxID=1045004 RepID=G9WF49_9LACO|nr:LysR family transcriptional regulator [Oenococcus kitaharae]EHN58769.1 CysB-like cys regulon transcriptional activator [Oenococcus kitaharae DSM 17330]MCV3296749.1 LysR family transcriptional regulator [Oenococcus kitaharae]OEY81884.1 LysR family transcriptional regulator [Oenococcus kitaharae]OEY84113.1 LysR family transcriptional regulator [Oenococcus kitaharae]OEY85527.1 LysR family transcriptional regulator [Oenococcus kitaharae]